MLAALCKLPIRSLSFPNTPIGNPGETGTGPPIKTFGGDAFGINSHRDLQSSILYPRLVKFQPHHLRRVPRAHRVKFVLVQAERFHIAPDETHSLHGIGEKRLTGVAG